MKLKLIAAFLPIASTVLFQSGAIAQTYSAQDVRFVLDVTRGLNAYGENFNTFFDSPGRAIGYGRQSCAAMAQGRSPHDLVEGPYLIAARNGTDPVLLDRLNTALSAVVVAAVYDFCPEYKPLLPGN